MKNLLMLHAINKLTDLKFELYAKVYGCDPIVKMSSFFIFLENFLLITID